MCDLGTGVIDFAKIFKKHQVEEYIVENDTPDVTPLCGPVGEGVAGGPAAYAVATGSSVGCLDKTRP